LRIQAAANGAFHRCWIKGREKAPGNRFDVSGLASETYLEALSAAGVVMPAVSEQAEVVCGKQPRPARTAHPVPSAASPQRAPTWLLGWPGGLL